MADELKSGSAEQDVPLPTSLAELLRKVKDNGQSEFVFHNSTEASSKTMVVTFAKIQF